MAMDSRHLVEDLCLERKMFVLIFYLAYSQIDALINGWVCIYIYMFRCSRIYKDVNKIKAFRCGVSIFLQIPKKRESIKSYKLSNRHRDVCIVYASFPFRYIFNIRMYLSILNRLGDSMWGGVTEVGNALCLVRLYYRSSYNSTTHRKKKE